MKLRKKFIYFLLTLAYCTLHIGASAADLQNGTDNIKTFIYANSGKTLQTGDEVIFSKYNYVIFHRFNYDDINYNTYSAIKKLNPNTKIFVYILGSTDSDDMDSHTIGGLDCIDRWTDARGHSQGNISIDNKDLLLLDSKGDRINFTRYPHDWLCDFGTQRYKDYWMEAVVHDIVSQPWKADGIFADNCMSVVVPILSGTPTKYSTNSAWSPAMVGFIDQMTRRLSSYNQSFGINYGSSYKSDGNSAWKLLDNTANSPEFALEEGAFVSWYGASPDANFFTTDEWKLQLKTLNETKNYNVFFQSHTTLNPGEIGTDNYGVTVSFWDVLWYAITSYKLGQHDNSYFGFQHNSIAGNYTNFPYFDEYTINIGNALGDYQIKIIDGYEIFMREFENGYVYVNPNNANINNIMLPGLGRQISHSNFLSDISSLPIINSINLLPHRGIIVRKASPDPTIPSVVNFSIPEFSSSLTVPITTFTAVDKIGVTGYLLSESAATPSINDARWKATAPASFTFGSLGTKTLYAWAKNATGNISKSVSDQVEIHNSIGFTEIYPNITTNGTRMAMPVYINDSGVITSVSIYHEGGSSNLLLGVYSNSNGLPSARLGVSESTVINPTAGWQTVPLINPITVNAGQTIWLAWVFQKNPGIRYALGTPGRAASTSYWADGMPVSFGSVNTGGTKYSIHYNYIPNKYLSDVTAPSITEFTIPSSSSSLTVPINSFAAIDNVNVTGYKLTESSNKPSAGDTGWSSMKPSSYTFSAAGTKILYAWAKDDAGNVSASASDQVLITLPPVSSNSIGNTEVFNKTTTSGYRYAMPVTFSEKAEITSISIYHEGGNGNLLLGIYSDTGGKPSDRLSVTSSTTINPTAGWQTISLSSQITVESGQTVWLSWVFENNPGIRYTDGTPGRAASTGFWADGMPVSFGNSTIGNTKFSIYCNYFPSGGTSVSNTLGDTEVLGNITTSGYRYAMPVTSNETIEITSLSIYHEGGTGNIIMGVYSDAGGKPGDRIGVTASTAINNSAGWQTVSLINPSTIASGQTVWLSWVFENNPGIRYIEGSPGRAASTGFWAGGMPVSFGSSTIGNTKFSIYCNYSTTGGGTIVSNTLGDTEVFGSITTSGFRYAMPVTFSEQGEITSLTIYHEGGTGKILMGVYSDLGGKPSDRLGTTASTSINSSAGWQAVSLINPITVSSGQTVWLSWVFENNPGIRYTEGTPGRAASTGFWADGLPTTFGTSTIGNTKFSIYCNYWVSGGTTVSNTLGNNEIYNSSTTSGFRYAMPVTFSETGEITSLSIYHEGGTGNLLLGVYSDLGGKPSSRLGTTISTAINNTAGWQTVSLASPVTVASGQTVWLSWVFENNPGIRYTIGTPGRAASTGFWADGMPTAFGASTIGNTKFSIYCNYLSNGGTSVFNTLGNTEVFGNITTSGYRYAMPVTFSESGLITSLSIFHEGGTGNLLLGVYSDAGGKPADRLGITSSTAINTAAGWQTVSLINTVSVSSGQTVWLSWVFENNPGVRYTIGTPERARAESFSYWTDGMPSSFGLSTIGITEFSIYCNYMANQLKDAYISGNAQNISVEESNSISEINYDFRFYPNPAKSYVNIEYSNIPEIETRIFIFDNTGRIVISRLVNSTNTNIDISKLSSGIYYIKSINQQWSSAKKIIIDNNY